MATTGDTRQQILQVAQRIIGSKGFSAVGLNEILRTAGVPKGSFYHYFESKDCFGEALLEQYFDEYLEGMDSLFAGSGDAAHLLNLYWKQWIGNQRSSGDAAKCLAVKLGAEVADLSERMRAALDRGTRRIIDRLARAIAQGQHEGCVLTELPADQVALRLYLLWLGASVLAKIRQDDTSFTAAFDETQRALGIGPMAWKPHVVL